MEMQTKPPTTKGPSAWFSGDVFVDPIAQGQCEQPMSVGSVHFTPCAHTAWHRHTIGQTLYVTEGVGYVQSRGGPLLTIRPGDVIRILGGEEHWHGATPDNFMTHIAITEGDTQWGDHLTDAEYHGQ
ncbi:MAG: (R)-mandelonitrile lyase [Acidimicrobiales bacterium]